jgi:hypothetical protein
MFLFIAFRLVRIIASALTNLEMTAVRLTILKQQALTLICTAEQARAKADAAASDARADAREVLAEAHEERAQAEASLLQAQVARDEALQVSHCHYIFGWLLRANS